MRDNDMEYQHGLRVRVETSRNNPTKVPGFRGAAISLPTAPSDWERRIIVKLEAFLSLVYSPRTWGCTDPPHTQDERPPLFPTHVGVYREGVSRG